MNLSKAACSAVLACTAALTAVATGTSNALAVEQYGTTQSIRTERSGAYFYDFAGTRHPDSEDLRVSDYKADGYGARAYLTWGDNKVSVYTNRGGKDVRCSRTQKGIA
jgi:hypothetical protein